MKLFYYKDINGNFGDDLNPWLWGRLLPHFFDDDASELFVGVGTLINTKLPIDSVKHVFGSGVGYGDIPVINEKFVFHAVRGYKSTKALGISDKLAITDAAVLVRSANPRLANEKVYKFGFMPTGESIENYNWEFICNKLGFMYISCHGNVEDTIYAISQCEILISEAMHGAIVADAIRVPWIPVCCSKNILAFKWEDWLSTLNIPYEPAMVSALYFRGSSGFKKNVKELIKRGLIGVGAWSKSWSLPKPRDSSEEDIDKSIGDLQKASLRPPYLSTESLICSLTDRYVNLIGSIGNRNVIY